MTLYRIPDPNGSGDQEGERRSMRWTVRSRWEADHGGPDGGRIAWERAPWPVNLGLRPGQWWWYTPGVPDELRGSGEVGDHEDYALQVARCEWLLAGGRAYLRVEEETHVVARLDQQREFARVSAAHGPDPRGWPDAG